LVDGGYADVTVAAAGFARDSGIYQEQGFFNVARREGLKTAYLEAFDQIGHVPSAVFQAVSSGMGLLSGLKAAVEFGHLRGSTGATRLFGIQQSGCNPMARGFALGLHELAASDVVIEPDGPAEAILRGDARQSYPHFAHGVRASNGAIMDVPHADIAAARQDMLSTMGIDICNASATAVAGLVRAVAEGYLRHEDDVLVNITGADRVTPTITPADATHQPCTGMAQ
jgi:threonine synthase